MKLPSPVLRAGTGLLVCAALLLLPACDTALRGTALRGTASPPADGTDAPPSGTPDATSEAALRAYYETLIADLKQALLDEKQADYITERDYEARISELEEKIAALQNATLAPGTDLPVSSAPEAPPAETEDKTETTAPSGPAAAAFQYAIEDGCAVITAYRGSATHVTVPASIAGFPVTRIADNAFRAAAVVSVTVPDGITHIGWFAFADCPRLATVTLPAALTAIDYGAFENCPALTVRCPSGSYAEKYAVSFALRVETTQSAG